MKMILWAGLTFFLAPLAGGLIAGLDRRVTAWLQARYGPPVLQPFYDVVKLLAKRPVAMNAFQVFCVVFYTGAALLSVVLFFLQQDLLFILFVQATGAVFLVLGALAVPSPYAQVGANRELIQILAYESLLVLVFVGIYLVTGSFRIQAVYEHPRPLLISLPLLYVALGYALTIKLRKSPFDFSTSHHAHQELVKGVMTEYSGPYLALTEIGHWCEIILLLGLCSLFWATGWIGVVVLLSVTLFSEILLDNVTARMTWSWMLRYAWPLGLVLAIVNLIWIFHGR